MGILDLLQNAEPYTVEVKETRDYTDEELQAFTHRLCAALEKLTGYQREFLHEEMVEQMEEASELYGSPINGITHTLTCALELDY